MHKEGKARVSCRAHTGGGGGGRVPLGSIAYIELKPRLNSSAGVERVVALARGSKVDTLPSHPLARARLLYDYRTEGGVLFLSKTQQLYRVNTTIHRYIVVVVVLYYWYTDTRCISLKTAILHCISSSSSQPLALRE